MKVYCQSMKDKALSLKMFFEHKYGHAPTHIEMSKVEYNLLVKQLGIERFHSTIESDTYTIHGMIITIEKEQT